MDIDTTEVERVQRFIAFAEPVEYTEKQQQQFDISIICSAFRGGSIRTAMCVNCEFQT